jgi:gliding motility-associated lipoprotein GldD
MEVNPGKKLIFANKTPPQKETPAKHRQANKKMKKIKTKWTAGWICALGLGAMACAPPTPKPSGYFRIDLPDATYRTETFAAFQCRVSEQAVVQLEEQPEDGLFFNLVYPRWGARIYASYLPLGRNNLAELSEESHKFVYLHAIKADAIREQRFDHPEARVYGLLYEIRGDVASPVQFVLTDSVHSFLRAALYFDNRPNSDSIAPVLEFIQKDIWILMENFRWKQSSNK